MASFPTFLFSGLFAVAVLLIMNVLFMYCRQRFRPPSDQPQGLPLNGVRQARQPPLQPAVWREAVCIVNPDGTSEYAAAALDPKEVQQGQEAIQAAPQAPMVLQPHQREAGFLRPGAGVTFM